MGLITIISITLLLITGVASTKQGCLSDRAGVANSKRVPLQRVECYCPCDRYRRDQRGRCVKCNHFYADSGFDKVRSIPAKQPWELLGLPTTLR